MWSARYVMSWYIWPRIDFKLLNVATMRMALIKNGLVVLNAAALTPRGTTTKGCTLASSSW